MRVVAALVLLVAPVLAGCAAPVDPASGGGPDALRAGLPGLPAGLDPFTAILCGDAVLPLAEARDASCNVKVTTSNGPAAEVHLAANPLDPLNLAGGAKDFTLGEDARCGKYSVWSGTYATTDGGRTWSNGLLPGHRDDARTTALSDYACGSDPVVVFGPDGTLYYTSLMFTDADEKPPHPALGPFMGGQKNAAVAVTRSLDGGATWDEPVLLTVRDAAGGLLDKQWMAVDAESGAVYVSYIEAAQEGSIFWIQRSDDRGLTWTEPVEITRTRDVQDGGPYQMQFGQVAVTRDGAVHFVHFAMLRGAEGSNLYHRRSHDGGATWSEPTTVAPFLLHIEPGVRQKYRVVAMPALAANPRDGSLGVLFPMRGHGDLDILFVRSTDGGATWSLPLTVNDDLVGPTNDQWMPALAVGPDGTWHATWIDYRDDPRGILAHVMYAHSADGATWSPNARLTSEPFDGSGGYHQSGSGTIGDYMGLAATKLGVHAFWADTREGRNDVWTAFLPGR